MKKTLSAALLLLAMPASAHNLWIKPSATTVSGEEGWVTFDAAASTDVFIPDHQPLRMEMIKAYAPTGTEVKLDNAMTGRYRSTFDLRLTQPGTWRVAVENAGVQGSFKLNGENYRVGGRPPAPGAAQTGPKYVPGGPGFALPAGATDVKLTQTASRNEVFVTLGKPTEIKPSGKGLEMMPLTHPADLISDEPGHFRFLVDGKPIAGLEVRLIPDGRRYRDAQGEITAQTDAAGEVKISWPAAGLYWMNATYTDTASTLPNVGGRRFTYVTTIEVMTP